MLLFEIEFSFEWSYLYFVKKTALRTSLEDVSDNQ